jgi:hypothetical protein
VTSSNHHHHHHHGNLDSLVAVINTQTSLLYCTVEGETKLGREMQVQSRETTPPIVVTQNFEN